MSLECNNIESHNVIKTIPIFIFPIHCNSKNTYYEKNRDKILCKYHERKKEISYYEKNKEKILNKYYENKEERLKYQIEYNLHHKDDLKERNRQYYISNREKMIEKAYRYKEENKEKLYTKIICECGGKFLFVGKNKHLITKKHTQFISKI
jgi:hypothetical protein